MGSAACYGKPLFASLWVRAWGERYPIEVQPFSSCTRELLHQLLREIAVSHESFIVDLGCGSGGVALWLARESGARVVGIDRKREAVAIAQARIRDWDVHGRVQFQCADSANTGMATNSVDAIVSVDAFPPGPEIDAILEECRRILRPGGRLVFTARQPPMKTERWGHLGPEWGTILERTGLELLKCTYRAGVSALWRRVYAEWEAHEEELRAELTDEAVDGLLAEVRRAGPTLTEERPWLLITASSG